MRLIGPRGLISPQMLIENAERFRDGSGLECVLLECGHRFIRRTPRDKDVYVDCLREHDLMGRRYPHDREYISWSEA